MKPTLQHRLIIRPRASEAGSIIVYLGDREKYLQSEEDKKLVLDVLSKENKDWLNQGGSLTDKDLTSNELHQILQLFI